MTDDLLEEFDAAAIEARPGARTSRMATALEQLDDDDREVVMAVLNDRDNYPHTAVARVLTRHTGLKITNDMVGRWRNDRTTNSR